MRKLFPTTLALLWCLPLITAPAARAQDDEARAIIAKAIKATGGEDKLAKLKATYTKGKGSIHIMGMDFDYTVEVFSQPPDKQKVVVDVTVQGQNINIIKVFNGGKGWQNAMGKTEDLDAETLADFKESANAERASGLVELKDKDYKLSTLGDSKVMGQEAVGVLVARKGYKDVSLYFDKKTHLLIKMERRAYDEFSKQEVNQESFFSEFKELIPGVQVPSKLAIHNEGKKLLDGTIIETRAVEKHDDSIFAKP